MFRGNPSETEQYPSVIEVKSGTRCVKTWLCNITVGPAVCQQ
jgi:hypothetical protein